MWCAQTATARGPTREGLRWAARIRTWTSWSRANRATVTPRPKGSPQDAIRPGPGLPGARLLSRSVAAHRVEGSAKRLQGIDLWADGGAGTWTAREWVTYHLIARSAGPFVKWPRTPPSQGGDTGSNPVGTTPSDQQKCSRTNVPTPGRDPLLDPLRRE